MYLFGPWLQGFIWEKKKIMFTDLCVFLWLIWLSRNDVVFHNNQKQTALQILFRATFLTRTWAILQKEEDRDLIADACRALEVTVMDIFVRNGWRLVIGFVACNLLPVYLSKFVIKAGYITLI